MSFSVMTCIAMAWLPAWAGCRTRYLAPLHLCITKHENWFEIEFYNLLIESIMIFSAEKYWCLRLPSLIGVELEIITTNNITILIIIIWLNWIRRRPLRTNICISHLYLTKGLRSIHILITAISWSLLANQHGKKRIRKFNLSIYVLREDAKLLLH